MKLYGKDLFILHLIAFYYYASQYVNKMVNGIMKLVFQDSHRNKSTVVVFCL